MSGYGWSRVATLAAVSGFVLFCVVVLSYLSVPLHQGSGRADVLLVLGSPTEGNGDLSGEQRWRVDEAIREYRRGRAPYLLMTGGAVANAYIEADTMALYAMSEGVPAARILREDRSRNTVENLRNSTSIVRKHGWKRVEFVSSAAHLHRAAVLLSGMGWEQIGSTWQTHAAPTPGMEWQTWTQEEIEEVLGTTLLRWCGVRAAPVLHAVVVMQQQVPRWPPWNWLRGW